MRARRWQLVRARGDAVPASLRRLSHAVAARRRALRPNRAWLLVGLALLLLVGLGILVYGTPIFGVRTVAVYGSRIATPDEVRAVAEVTPGTPLARVDTDSVAARVRTLPSVASVSVSRSWPSTLVIHVLERDPVAAVAVGKAGHETSYLVLDEAGVVFNEVAARPKKLLLVRVAADGLGAANASTRAAAHVAVALTARLRAKVREIVVTTPSNIRLELSGGVTVIWGDARLSDLKAQVATALLDKAHSRIDVSVPEVVAVT